MRAKPSALACTQPRRSTTRTGAELPWATRPVKSRTSPVERLASSRSSVTAAAASAGVTSGPSPATFAPRFTAKSQSTIDVMGRP